MFHFDRISKLLLFFALFILLLFSYLIQVNNSIKEYDLYQSTLTEIKLLNKSFDNFLLKRATFVNYDSINRDMLKFQKKIDFLDSSYSLALYGEEYKLHLENLKKSFAAKENFIENFKSNRATLLNSIHYVFELNQALQEDSFQKKNTQNIAINQTLLLTKYYINSYIDLKIIENNQHILEQIAQEENNNSILELFLMHTSRNVERIRSYNLTAKLLYKEAYVHENIIKIHDLLNENYQKNMSLQQSITTLFFALALIILYILYLMYKRSLSIKEELLGYKSAVENSDNSIVMTDVDKNITYVNDIFEKETGYTKEELLGKNPRILKSGEMPQEMYNELNAKLDKGEKWEGEFINMRKDKSLYYEKASIIPIFVGQSIKYYLAIKLNITNYIEQREKMQFLALHDALTTLPNRLNIEREIQKKIEVAKENSSMLAILFIDLDRFKIINDTLGHDIGDELLIKTAQRLKKVLRESDKLARLGGDEFLILLDPLEDRARVTTLCESIIRLFSEPIKTKKHELNITLSIGVSLYPNDALEYQALLKHADIAMYQAKNSGKNTFRYYQKELSYDIQDRLNIEQAFSSALANNQFFLTYQPKYTLDSREVVGLEALVRWKNSDLDMITPDRFIPIAEDTGFILELGLFIFKEACEAFLLFKKESTSLESISINISAVQLYQENFLSEIVAITKEVNIAPHSITLEITETYIMKNIMHSMRVLEELQALGFSISIDDFGTGHSSLNYLQKFPINELKIDKSFIDGVLDNPNDIAITEVIINLSKSLNYINVAEGIESQEQEDFLRESGCALGQGYYFCMPKEREELLSFLQNRAN